MTKTVCCCYLCRKSNIKRTVLIVLAIIIAMVRGRAININFLLCYWVIITIYVGHIPMTPISLHARKVLWKLESSSSSLLSEIYGCRAVASQDASVLAVRLVACWQWRRVSRPRASVPGAVRPAAVPRAIHAPATGHVRRVAGLGARLTQGSGAGSRFPRCLTH